MKPIIEELETIGFSFEGEQLGNMVFSVSEGSEDYPSINLINKTKQAINLLRQKGIVATMDIIDETIIVEIPV